MFRFLFFAICFSHTLAGPLFYPLENVIEKPQFNNDFSYTLFNDILESNALRNVLPLLPISTQQIQDYYKIINDLMQLISPKSSYIQQFIIPNKPFVQNWQEIYELFPNSRRIIEIASRMANSGTYILFSVV